MGKAMLVAFLLCGIASTLAAPSFTIENNRFVRDGQETLLFTGCLHYARVHPALWADRISRMRAMGLNAVEFYVPWNFHNPSPGVYNFSFGADLAGFLQAVKDQKMLALVRAGPYVCGEWEFGGLPAFLLNKSPAVTIRTYEAGYITEVDKWWRTLLPVIKPFLYENGGPVVMVQVENEFGSYGNVQTNHLDKQYMQYLVDLARSILGNTIILYTTDGGDEGYMSRGTLPGQVLTAGDFGPGSNPQSSFDAQKKFNAKGKSVNICTEYYTGWLTHWGESMANTSSHDVAASLEQIITLGGSFSLYMAHGGSNFGFWAGANGGGGTSYSPHITSYDYDGPISEGGGMGYGSDGLNKFEAIKQVLVKYPQPFANPVPPYPPVTPLSFGVVPLTRAVSLLDSLAALSTATFVNQADVQPQEKYNQSMGFTLYSNQFPRASHAVKVDVRDARDRAQIFVNRQYYGTIDRTAPAPVLVPAGVEGVLDILVENQGRINYGHGMTDPKGIVGDGVFLDGVKLTGGWAVRTLPLDPRQLARLSFGPLTNQSSPTFYTGTFTIDAPQDTYLAPRGWRKGSIWVNGFNLGRYWEPRGPQHTLYVPAPVLQSGVNTVVVLELETPAASLAVQSVDAPLFYNGSPCDPSTGIAAGSLVAMFSADSTYTAAQQWIWSAPGPVRLASNTSLCLAVGPHPDPSTGQPALQLAPCSDSHARTFGYKAGSKEITVDRSCVDITAHGHADGASLEIYGCNGGDNQQFTVQNNRIVASYQSIRDLPFVITACAAQPDPVLQMSSHTVH